MKLSACTRFAGLALLSLAIAFPAQACSTIGPRDYFPFTFRYYVFMQEAFNRIAKEGSYDFAFVGKVTRTSDFKRLDNSSSIGVEVADVEVTRVLRGSLPKLVTIRNETNLSCGYSIPAVGEWVFVTANRIENSNAIEAHVIGTGPEEIRGLTFAFASNRPNAVSK